MPTVDLLRNRGLSIGLMALLGAEGVASLVQLVGRQSSSALTLNVFDHTPDRPWRPGRGFTDGRRIECARGDGGRRGRTRRLFAARVRHGRSARSLAVEDAAAAAAARPVAGSWGAFNTHATSCSAVVRYGDGLASRLRRAGAWVGAIPPPRRRAGASKACHARLRWTAHAIDATRPLRQQGHVYGTKLAACRSLRREG